MSELPTNTANHQALTVIDRARQALAHHVNEQTLQALAEKYADLNTVRDKTDHKLAMSALAELRNTRLSITRAGKTAREDAQAFSQAVIDEEKRLIAFIKPAEDRLQQLRKDYETRLERQRQEAERRERERIAALRARITRINEAPFQVVGQSAEQIHRQLDNLNALVIGDDFQEFAAEATVARDKAMAALQTLHTQAQERETAEAERRREIAEQQAREAEATERRRQEAEQLARQRAEQERQAVQLQAQQQAIERQRAEIERRRQAAEQQAQAGQGNEQQQPANVEPAPAKTTAAQQPQNQTDQPPPAKPAPAPAVTLPPNLEADIRRWAKARRVSKAALEELLDIIARHQPAHSNRQAA